MLRNWLKRRVELRTARSGRDTLERFVASLRAQPDSEIATLVAVSAATRMRLREAGHLPDDALRVNSMNEYEQAMIQQRISRLVTAFLADNEYIEAAGAMVWLHTMRSLGNPELRHLGRELWQQLQRGFLYSHEALARIESVTHRAPPAGTLTACGFIPDDLVTDALWENNRAPDHGTESDAAEMRIK